jgi:hypothetical protein
MSKSVVVCAYFILYGSKVHSYKPEKMDDHCVSIDIIYLLVCKQKVSWGRVETQTHTPPGNAVCQRSIPMVHGFTLVPIQPNQLGLCVSACLTTLCVHMHLNVTTMVSLSLFYIFGVLYLFIFYLMRELLVQASKPSLMIC